MHTRRRNDSTPAERAITLKYADPTTSRRLRRRQI